MLLSNYRIKNEIFLLKTLIINFNLILREVKKTSEKKKTHHINFLLILYFGLINFIKTV